MLNNLIEVRPTPLYKVSTLSIPAGTRTLSLLIGDELSPHTDMWGPITNTGFDGMPTFLASYTVDSKKMRDECQREKCGYDPPVALTLLTLLVVGGGGDEKLHEGM